MTISYQWRWRAADAAELNIASRDASGREIPSTSPLLVSFYTFIHPAAVLSSLHRRDLFAGE